jgi:hypothetical protein
MKTMFLLLFTFALSAAAQTGSTQANTRSKPSKKGKNEVTVQGCVSKSNTDYILMQTDPGNTYELQATGKLHLRDYLGQQVEVTGVESPSLLTSSDSLTKSGPASAVTITISSIKTLEKKCSAE